MSEAQPVPDIEKQFITAKEGIISSLKLRGGNPKAKMFRAGYETVEIARAEIRPGHSNSFYLNIDGIWDHGYTDEIPGFVDKIERRIPFENDTFYRLVDTFAGLADSGTTDLVNRYLNESSVGESVELGEELNRHLSKNRDRLAKKFVEHLESFASDLETPKNK